MRATKSFLAIENFRMLVEIDRDVVSKFHLSKSPRNGTTMIADESGDTEYRKPPDSPYSEFRSYVRMDQRHTSHRCGVQRGKAP